MARTYTEAKELLSASGLRPKTEAEFRQLAKDGALPPGLPKYPYEKYKNNGWISWGDFLESGYVANANRSYVSYEEAKRIIANANPRPRTRSEYNEAIRSGVLPSNLPLNAPLIYKNDGWQGVGDYLGTGRVATHHQKFLSYAECKEAIRAMELPPTSQKEWQLMAKRDQLPPGIPHDPSGTYSDEFEGYPAFLGFHRLASVSRPELRIRAELNSILGEEQVQRWQQGASTLKEIDLWIPEYGIGIEYDGVTWHSGKEERDLKKNQLAAQLGITIFRVREQDPKRKRFLATIDTKQDVKYDVTESLHSTLIELFRLIAKRIPNLPPDVQQSLEAYSQTTDFINQHGYLDLVSAMDDRFMSYEEAKTFLATLPSKLENSAQYREQASKGLINDRIPRDPFDYYRETGWISWGDFLGTGTIASFDKKFLSLQQAKDAIAQMPDPPKNRREYLAISDAGKLPDGLPRDPYNTYHQDPNWKGLPDLLGLRNRQNYATYEDAKQIIREMESPIKSQSHYRTLSKQGLLPIGLPGDPQGVYAKKGWASWYDFLGK